MNSAQKNHQTTTAATRTITIRSSNMEKHKEVVTALTHASQTTTNQSKTDPSRAQPANQAKPSRLEPYRKNETFLWRLKMGRKKNWAQKEN